MFRVSLGYHFVSKSTLIYFVFLVQSIERQMNGTAFHIVLLRTYQDSRTH